jgi:hypothetical protein
VPGVGNASQGDTRTRQAAGTVTDPTNADSDSDGIPDGMEDANINGWTDGDGKSLPLTATIAQGVRGDYVRAARILGRLDVDDYGHRRRARRIDCVGGRCR